MIERERIESVAHSRSRPLKWRAARIEMKLVEMRVEIAQAAVACDVTSIEGTLLSHSLDSSAIPELVKSAASADSSSGEPDGNMKFSIYRVVTSERGRKRSARTEVIGSLAMSMYCT